MSKFLSMIGLSGGTSEHTDSLRNWDNSNPATNGEASFARAYAQTWKACFDVGANTGEYAQLILSSNPSCHVVCFEPNPDLAKRLRRNRRLTVFEYAVGEKRRRVTLNLNPHDPGLSSLWRRNQYSYRLAVNQTTLDWFCSRQRINWIDFLKIDTEGNEANVIKGAKKLISEQRIGMLQFEYGGTYLDAGTSLKEVYDLLTPNYLICHLLPNALLPLPYSQDLETFRYSNWVALSRNIFK